MSHRIATYAILSLLPLSSLADGSPWLPIPHSGTVNLSYVFQTADEFYRAAQKSSTPAGGQDIDQHTLWLNVNYGLSEEVALDLKMGYAKSEYVVDPPRSFDESLNGLSDSSIGLTWRLVDEDISEIGLPSVAVRAAWIVAGDYETGSIHSIGDGANGVEGSLIVGKIFAERVALSGELGYRQRSQDVPNDVFFNLGAYFIVTPKLTGSLEYKLNNAVSGLDIGAPGFSPARFPELKEESEIIGVGVSYNATNTLNLGLNLATVIDGRNTNDTNAIGLSVAYAFDLY